MGKNNWAKKFFPDDSDEMESYSPVSDEMGFGESNLSNDFGGGGGGAFPPTNTILSTGRISKRVFAIGGSPALTSERHNIFVPKMIKEEKKESKYKRNKRLKTEENR